MRTTVTFEPTDIQSLPTLVHPGTDLGTVERIHGSNDSRRRFNTPFRSTLPLPIQYIPILCLTLLLSIGLNAHAAIPESTELTKTDDLLRRGDFAGAAELARQTDELLVNLDQPGLALAAKLKLAEAQRGLGEYQSAAKTLKSALSLATNHRNAEGRSRVLGSLGNIETALGNLDQANNLLRSAAKIAEPLKASMTTAKIFNDIGNLRVVQNRHEEALAAYLKSISESTVTSQTLLTARTLANAASVCLTLEKFDESRKLLGESAELALSIDDSHNKVYLLINISRSLQRLQFKQPYQSDIKQAALKLLTEATRSASELDDSLGKSYALGFTGRLYEHDRRYTEALDLTVRAIFHAQVADSRPAYYIWEWQRGRLLNKLGRRSPAIAAYKNAVSTLKTLRFRLSTGYGVTETSFRENVELIYVERINLLLQAADTITDSTQTANYLRAARDTMESLKAAELRNYFRDDCVDAILLKLRSVEETAKSAAIVYPIPLNDRLELLLILPGGDIKKFSVPVNKTRLTAEVRRFRQLLEKRTTNQFRVPSQMLYKWIILPLESELKSADIDTLVFVPNGALGTVPMSALYDGKQFLIEKFAVGITPGVKLTDPKTMQAHQASIVMGGISKSVQGFPALHRVVDELDNIQSIFGGTQLLNEKFQSKALKTVLESRNPDILHFSTHGKFEKDADKSFILTYDRRLTMRQLADYIGLFKYRETPLELLVLSAFETAQGDDRAALGLSGIAVKVGAISAIGTLWKVHGAAAAELVSEFYQQLYKPRTSRAIAVQRAKLKLINDIRYRHPGYWSAFLLINSWL